ncbi:penicillin-binding protein 2 [Vibrio sp. SS-MA-C1-2]|nr:penicillin-binding protein 2 [Vibrio sp. SS-MA-C1-2]
MWYLEVDQFTHYSLLAKNNRIEVIPVAPRRGEIFDRNGIPLAINHLVYHLSIRKDQTENLNHELELLQQKLSLSDQKIDQINKKLQHKSSFREVDVLDLLSETQVAEYAANEFHFPGISIATSYIRYYPYGEYFTHVLGYVGKINDRDIRRLKKAELYKDYRASKFIGKLGIERSYERDLHGKPGYRVVEVNNIGKVIRTLNYQAPIKGKDIVTNLDVHLQEYAFNLLIKKQKDTKTGLVTVKQRPGAIVVLNPQDNSVLAMVSSPSYNPNDFVSGISSKKYKALLNNPDRPLLNRATLGVYPPGSTVKPQIAIAALTEGVITPKTTYNFPGWWTIPDTHSRKFRDDQRWGYGNVNIYKAIEKSVDTFFYQVVYDLGVDRLSLWMNKFGYGHSTGIDIKEESDGNMPTRKWKHLRFDTPWYKGDTISLGIGQGYWSATPLQMAKAASVIATEGRIGTPHIFKQFKDQPAKSYHEDSKAFSHVPKKYWDISREGMHLVVTKGTARSAFKNVSYKVAGKTGTSQVFGLAKDQTYNAEKLAKNLQDHALFTAFAPLNNPKILVSIVLEHAGWGKNAAPLAKEIMDYELIGKDNKPKN